MRSWYDTIYCVEVKVKSVYHVKDSLYSQLSFVPSARAFKFPLVGMLWR